MNDENLSEAQAAFERLSDQATGLDTMAALRAIEHRSRRRRQGLGAVAVASAAIVALVVFVALRSDRPEQEVATPTSSTTSPWANPPNGALEQETWTLLFGHSPTAGVSIVDDRPFTLTFDGSELIGTLACRQYRANYRREGATIAVDGLVDGVGRGTVPCDGDVWESEEAFLAALGGAERMVLDGGSLVLSGPSTELSFTSDPPVPTDQLVDQLWLLDTVTTDGQESPAEGDPATLFFESGGTFHGSTGCRSLSGDYVIEGARLWFPTIGGGGVCPPELADQDDLLRRALGDDVTVLIDDDRLRLRSSGGRSLTYLAIDRSPVTADEELSIDEFQERPRYEEAPVEVSGHLVNRGGPWVLCESARFAPAVGHFCDGPWITVTNYDRVVAAQVGPGNPDEAALAMAEVNPDFTVDDSTVWTPEAVTLTLIAVDDDSFRRSRTAVPSWPTDVDLTSEDLDLVAAFDAIDGSGPIDVSALRLSEAGVQLGLGQYLLTTRTPDELTDPESWTLDLELHPTYAGPISALEALAGPQETTVVVVGSHAHCPSAPMPVHPDLQALRRISIQPSDIDSCHQWQAVDLYIDDAGDVAAITMEAYEP